MTPEHMENLFERTITPDVLAASQDYLAARAERDHAEGRLETAQKRLAAYETILVKKLDEAGIKSVVVSNEEYGEGILVTAACSDYYRLPAGALDTPSLVAWILRHGGHDLIERHVDRNRLTAFCRRITGALHPLIEKVTRRVVRVNNR